MVQGKQQNKAVWLEFPSHSLNGDCAAYVNQICGLKEAWGLKRLYMYGCLTVPASFPQPLWLTGHNLASATVLYLQSCSISLCVWGDRDMPVLLFKSSPFIPVWQLCQARTGPFETYDSKTNLALVWQWAQPLFRKTRSSLKSKVRETVFRTALHVLI